MAERQTLGGNVLSFLEGTSQRDESPLTARSRFRHRHLRSWAKALLIFGGVAIVLAVVLPGYAWFGDIFAALALWYLVFHVWDKDPIVMRCPHKD